MGKGIKTVSSGQDFSNAVVSSTDLDVASDIPSAGDFEALAGLNVVYPVHSALNSAAGRTQGVFSGVAKIIRGVRTFTQAIKSDDKVNAVVVFFFTFLRGIAKTGAVIASSAKSVFTIIVCKLTSLPTSALTAAGKVLGVAGKVLGTVSTALIALPCIVRSAFSFGLLAELDAPVSLNDSVKIKPAKLKEMLKRLEKNADYESLSFMDKVLFPPLTEKEEKYLIDLGYIEGDDKFLFIEEKIIFATKMNYAKYIGDDVAKKTIERFKKEGLSEQFEKFNEVKALTMQDVKDIEKFLVKRGVTYTTLALAATASIIVGIVATVATGGLAITGVAIAGLVMSGVWLLIDGHSFAEAFKKITADSGSTTDKVVKGLMITTAVLSIIGTVAFTAITGGTGAVLLFAVIGAILSGVSGSFAAAMLIKEAVLKLQKSKAQAAVEEAVVAAKALDAQRVGVEVEGEKVDPTSTSQTDEEFVALITEYMNNSELTIEKLKSIEESVVARRELAADKAIKESRENDITENEYEEESGFPPLLLLLWAVQEKITKFPVVDEALVNEELQKEKTVDDPLASNQHLGNKEYIAFIKKYIKSFSSLEEADYEKIVSAIKAKQNSFSFDLGIDLFTNDHQKLADLVDFVEKLKSDYLESEEKLKSSSRLPRSSTHTRGTS